MPQPSKRRFTERSGKIGGEGLGHKEVPSNERSRRDGDQGENHRCTL